MHAPLRVLFTSVGRRVELIRHFLDYAAHQPEDMVVFGTEIDRFAPAAQYLGDALFLVPRVSDPGYVATIAKLCHDHRIDVVFPLIDPDIAVLGHGGTDIPLASVSNDAAAIVSDKWLTFGWLIRHGIPTAESWLPEEVADPVFPLFMKPRRGSGGIDAFKVRSIDELNFFQSYIEEPIVQELLAGPEVTVDVIVGIHGEHLASVQRKRLAVRGGEVSRGVVIEDPAVAQLVQKVVLALEPTGPITVQGMYAEDGSFRVTEINARMGGGLPLAVAAGVPVAKLLVDSWLGRPRVPLHAIDVGLHMVRFDDSMFYRP